MKFSPLLFAAALSVSLTACQIDEVQAPDTTVGAADPSDPTVTVTPPDDENDAPATDDENR